MNYARPLLLAASVLALLSACAQPADLQRPELEPQFGTSDDDLGAAAALTPTGHVLVLSEQAGNTYDEEAGFYENALLKRYDPSGKLVSSKVIATTSCSLYEDECYSDALEVRSLQTDAKSFSYALLSFTYVVDDTLPIASHYVYKVNAKGNVVRKVWVGTSGSDSRAVRASDNVVDAAVDKDGNLYVVHRHFEYDWDGSGTYSNLITKYTTHGVRVWRRRSPVGVPYGVTVSGSGSVYVVGAEGLARLTNSGSLTWRRAANNSRGVLSGEVVLSGANAYTRSVRVIRKYTGSGKELWSRTQGGLNTLVVQDMTGDAQGNLYLAGKYKASPSNTDAFVRKLNSSGRVLWTKTYGTPRYDDARGLATLDGSAIYTTGETQGSLAHPNRGGPERRDGYLRRFSSSGAVLWTR